MKRLAAALGLVLVLALAPQVSASGPIAYHGATSAPTGLHGFLLRPDEAPTAYFPRTPSFTTSSTTAVTLASMCLSASVEDLSLESPT